MSTFRVPVARVRAVESIPDADAIELAVVGDFRSVVRKGQFAPGDLAAYMPEGALLPEWLLRRLGFWDDEKGKGKLAGSAGDRIKAARMRGALSQGILLRVASPLDVMSAEGAARTGAVDTLPLPDDGGCFAVVEGDDVAERLGVTKYEPPIPASMGGEVAAIFGVVPKYDIENRKAWPDVLVPGETVALTEKIHGTHCSWGYVPGLGHPDLFRGGDVYVGSKGLSAQGFVFKDVEANVGNVYVMALRKLERAIDAIVAAVATPGHAVHAQPVHVKGEVFGAGVQDLGYGLKERAFRGFEVYVGPAGQGRWMGVEEKRAFMAEVGIEPVDFLFVGPYDQAVVDVHRDGKSVTGGGAHIREGVVITPLAERVHPGLGRVLLKEVSPAYLLRRGEVTEFS